jgi:putative (di)nucleoside polyphosphate hydrolase
MIDERGYRHGVSVVLVNENNKIFLAKRVRQADAWQFPQGGLQDGETYEQALFRELYEEVGLESSHVEILARMERLLSYDLPDKFIRRYSRPLCIGQSHRWFLLKLKPHCEQHIQLDRSDVQEFDRWMWVNHEEPLRRVIHFKQAVYRAALEEFQQFLVTTDPVT